MKKTETIDEDIGLSINIVDGDLNFGLGLF